MYNVIINILLAIDISLSCLGRIEIEYIISQILIHLFFLVILAKIFSNTVLIRSGWIGFKKVLLVFIAWVCRLVGLVVIQRGVVWDPQLDVIQHILAVNFYIFFLTKYSGLDVNFEYMSV